MRDRQEPQAGLRASPRRRRWHLVSQARNPSGRNSHMTKSLLRLGTVAAAVVIGGSAFAAQPDLNGIWGGNLIAGSTNVVDSCQTVVNAGGNSTPRFAYQGRTGSQQWVTFEQDCGIGHRGKVNKPLYKPQY